MSRVPVISSDGHVAARMADYRPYLDVEFRADFDEFLVQYEKYGVVTVDAENVNARLDPEAAAEWLEKVAEPGRLDSMWDPERRIVELDREGISAEVLFQEFATPFMMSSPTRAMAMGLAPASVEQLSAGFRAYNRWLADFRSVAPERWIGMAAVSFHDLGAAVEEIRAAARLGCGGVAIPAVEDTARIYQAEYDPVWAVMEELGLVANFHVAIANSIPTYVGAPTATSGRALVGSDVFTGIRGLLPSLIFGGVLERFPGLKVVFTETHSDWVLGALARMDHSWTNSELKRDIRDVVKMRPSEYWARQGFLGSSIFSRAEIGARGEIGVDKMMIGIDFPHSEGAWRHGTLRYLQATFGAEGVAPAEAERMLYGNAAQLYGFDVAALGPVVERSGLDLDEVLTAPEVEPQFRGDLHRPLIHG
ncbi:putative TIM-barrel fold metal-dependent hydrolase [Rhodococcus sp. 27YEA15]|uniref:amidohydrolase family protein n=1 Tax=Rhodococcus sp. 27YEA15 TaxID=3156259 RepID=UPI003C7ABA61